MPMKTVLIITQRFYPDPVVGAVRMTQWAKLLPKHGWIPVIACRNYGFEIDQDEVRTLFHPDAAVVHLNDRAAVNTARNQGQELRTAAVRMLGSGVIGRAPRNFLLRQAKALATKVLADRAQAEDAAFWHDTRPRIADLVRKHRAEVVITSSPPVALHALGQTLKQEFPHIRWLADFRDEYRQGGQYRVKGLGGLRSHAEFKAEAAIYRDADAITCATPTQQRWIRKRFANDSAKASTVLNGVPEELSNAVSDANGQTRDAFVKVVGFSDAVEAVSLAKAVAAASDVTTNLKFVGRPPSARQEIEQVLGERVVFTGAVRHDLALAEIASARALVAILSERRSRISAVASKLFEYLAVPTPVIVLNPSTTARTLFRTLAGVWMLVRPSVEDIRTALDQAASTPPEDLRARATLVQDKWGRASQVAHVASMLDGLVGEAAGDTFLARLR